MKSKETGRYRIFRDKKGVLGKPLNEYNSKLEAIEALTEIQKESEWNYYIEKEVIYQGTQFDEHHNPIDSAPSWIRI